VEATLEAMVGSGQLLRDGTPPRYTVPIAYKQHLEQLFRDSARELGVTSRALAPVDPEGLPATFEDDEEPRLPITAGLLSLFLPGTGQLLNGDVGRASLVFAVFSLAWITHLSPVWTFVCLYAGAEAFFTAKVRGLERRLAREALQGPATAKALPPGAR
jgi:TM2 domain-containing membrane protein YozV